jgi:hypothetical protein
VSGHVFKEEASSDALADESSLHVGEGHHNGVYLTGRHLRGELVEREVSGIAGHLNLSIEVSNFRPLEHRRESLLKRKEIVLGGGRTTQRFISGGSQSVN